MALFKCKMCGGDLEIAEGVSIAECEYCGTKQTVPKAMDENLQSFFNRANILRIKSEFDKAAALYEKIIQADPTQSEAYWGLILCKYGIEYVDDPATLKKIPTCHRASYDSIISDDDYKSALENADMSQRAIYEEQAKEIDRIQKDILALAQKEETYDVFICYKETDANGQRTQDSVIANDIYYQLTNEGFKVFYAAITLEGKLGSAYEPIIFAALNSAKVMLAIGTKPEYYNAVWVKNEWSRFLNIIKKDRSKLLIPCYRDMDAYELPEEFAHLQAQDMAKIGFINDLVRGIKKVIKKDEPKATTVVKETVVTNNNSNANPLIDRAFLFLEDGNWESADEYAEKALDLDPKNARAYVVKLMVEFEIHTQEELEYTDFELDNDNYKKALRFADADLKETLTKFVLEERYSYALFHIEKAKDIETGKNIENGEDIEPAKAGLDVAISYYQKALEIFEDIEELEDTLDRKYKDSDLIREQCNEKIAELTEKIAIQEEEARKDEILSSAKSMMGENEIVSYEEAIELLSTISGWKDADSLVVECQTKIEELKVRAEADRVEAKRRAKVRAKRFKKIAIIATPIACVIIAFIVVLNLVIIPNAKYHDAIALLEAGKYTEALSAFDALDGYKDSSDKIEECIFHIYGEEIWNKIKSVNVGDTYRFGSYEQDNNQSNGAEEIEWLVLSKEGTKILVISKYALDGSPYHTNNDEITWETCTLRKWLNNEFINAAFSAEEKAMIPTVTVSADKNPRYNTDPGNATQDQLFLLSIKEVKKYFGSDMEKYCKPTAYAIAHGGEDAYSFWWLRSPGKFQYCAAAVFDNSNDISEYGEVAHRFHNVRPAMWIDLSKIK